MLPTTECYASPVLTERMVHSERRRAASVEAALSGLPVSSTICLLAPLAPPVIDPADPGARPMAS